MPLPASAQLGNLANIVEQSTVLALLAFGMSIVIIGGGGDVIRGGIDLSLGANLGLCVAVYTVASNAAGYSDAAGRRHHLGDGRAVGLLNGLAVVGLGILPLLATLAVMNICAGAELVLTQNTVLTREFAIAELYHRRGVAGSLDHRLVLIVTSALLIRRCISRAGGCACKPWAAIVRRRGLPGCACRPILSGTYIGAGCSAALAAIVQAARLSGSSPAPATSCFRLF